VFYDRTLHSSKCNDSGWIVGKPYLGITSGLPVILPESRPSARSGPAIRKWEFTVGKFRFARHPRRTPEIPAQQLFFLEKRALQLFHSDDVSCHGHLVMTSELRGWGKLGITLRDEFLTPPRYYK
jgi:hypothetical protein